MATSNILVKSAHFLLVSAACAAAILVAPPSRAAIVTWDANGSSPTKPADGSGTWSTSVARWSNGTVDGNWTPGNIAVIGNNNLAAGTITLGTAITVAGITFNPAGSGSYTIASPSFVLTLGSATPFVANANATISAILGGNSVVLTKTGTGTIFLTGANTYTGTTAINSGTIDLGGSTATGSLNSTTALVLGGGNLSYTRTGNTTQQFASTTLNAGESAVSAVAGDTLALAAITRNTGGTVNFSNTGAVTTTTATTSNGVLVDANGNAYATFGGTNWAGESGGTIVGVTGVTGVGNYTSGNNVDVTNGDSVSGVTVNTLRFNAAGADALTLAGTNTVSTGGILVTAGTTASTVGTSTLQPGAGGELVIIDNGSLNLSAGTTIAGTNVTVSGPGTTTFSNTTNTYTGKTFVNGGILNIAADGSLGAAPGSLVADQLTLNDGALVQLASNINLATNRGITVNGGVGGGGGIDTNGFNSTYAGVIAGTGVFIKTGSGTLTLTGSNTNTGGLTISGGTVSYSAIANLGSITSPIELDGGTLQITGSPGFPAVKNPLSITLNGGTLDDSILIASKDAGSYTGPFSYIGSGAHTLTLTGTGTGGTIFGGALVDAGGATSIVKNGTGTWVLSAGNATYTGDTDINAGILRVDGTNAVSSVGTVFLASGATLSLGNKIATNQTIANLQDGAGGGGTIMTGFLTTALVTIQQGSFSGKISDQSNRMLNFSKTTSGTLTLSGSNTYTGNTTVSGGTLVIGGVNNTSLGFGGADGLNNTAVGTTTISGGTVDLNGATVNEPVTLNGGNLINNSVTNAKLDNGIAGITLTGTGAGYGGTITVAISGGGGSAGTATATISGTAITSVTVTNAGTGYTSAPTVTINGSTGGSGTATATAVLSSLGLVGNANNIGGSGTLQINAVIADSGGAGGFSKVGTGTVILDGANTYTGGTTVTAGTLQAGVASIANTSGAFGNNSAVTVNGGNLDINGFATQIGSLTGTGGTVLNNGASVATLSVGGDNTSPAAYAGTIANGSSALALTKIGTGTQILSGINTYSGATAINSGTLQLNGSNSNSATAVNSTGVLAGTGTAADLTLNSGGSIAPGVGAGDTTGNLKASSLTWNSGSSLAFNLSGSSLNTTSLTLTGALTAGTGSVFNINLTDSSEMDTAGTYDLVNFGSTNFLDATAFTLNSSLTFGAGLTGTLVLNGNQLDFDVASAVPEPSTWALMFGGLALLIYIQRRQRNKLS